MADSIVGGLFGVSPQQLMQQRQARDIEQQFLAGRTAATPGSMMSPSLAPFYAQATQQGQMIGRGVGALLGAQDPELQRITAIQQLSSQFDLSSPEGMRGFAQALQPIAPNESMMAAKRADEMMSVREQTKLRTAQTEQAQAGRVVQVDLGDRIQLVNALTKEVISETPKGLTPQQAAKARGEGEGDGIGKPGPVGKSGAYRDISGQILGPTEMKTVRQEFEGAQKLLNTLNQISAQDVKDAESYIDWTTKAETKGLASDKTLKAQTKVAASQLLEQINQLPPGSASDADMRAAMKSFPGYSNPAALAEWVNRTKALLQFSIDRGVDQFGFSPRVKPTAPLDLSQKQTKTKATTSDTDLINKYLPPKK